MDQADTYTHLIALLDRHGAQYRLIDHAPEGRTELELIVDPSLLEHDEIYFNAARLERSMVLKTSDYIAVARPRLGRIAERGKTFENPSQDWHKTLE